MKNIYYTKSVKETEIGKKYKYIKFQKLCEYQTLML